jgi:hypothetical protein
MSRAAVWSKFIRIEAICPNPQKNSALSNSVAITKRGAGLRLKRPAVAVEAQLAAVEEQEYGIRLGCPCLSSFTCMQDQAPTSGFVLWNGSWERRLAPFDGRVSEIIRISI